MNIRKIAGEERNFYKFNREERNLVAILFAALCEKRGLAAFLSLLQRKGVLGEQESKAVLGNPEDFGIYLEYAYLRDLWKAIGDREDLDEDRKNEIRKEILRKYLTGIKDREGRELELEQMSVVEINEIFGVSGRATSTQYIQFPGRWSVEKFAKNFGYDDFCKICKFKWAFNIKPDMVIHLDKDRTICIEAKLESGEGTYTAKHDDGRSVPSTTQIELQKYLMEELLGLETKFVFLSRKPRESADVFSITWEEIDKEVVKESALPSYALEQIKKSYS